MTPCNIRYDIGHGNVGRFEFCSIEPGLRANHSI